MHTIRLCTHIHLSTCQESVCSLLGGNKATGWGRESGSDAWKEYMRRSAWYDDCACGSIWGTCSMSDYCLFSQCTVQSTMERIYLWLKGLSLSDQSCQTMSTTLRMLYSFPKILLTDIRS